VSLDRDAAKEKAMKKLHWPIPVVGVFVAALATAQEPAPKPAAPHTMQHGMMRDGGAPMPMEDMSAMMDMMRSMTPEQRAKMMTHCRQMMDATASDSNKSDK
jgi:hypothetical protein